MAMDSGLEQMLRVKSMQDVAGNMAALASQRAKDGHVAVQCKCGAESILDANRPAKGPAAKCGVCGAELKG